MGFVLVATVFAITRWPLAWIDEDSTAAGFMVALFGAGLLLVILEDHVGVHKAAVMLMVSSAMWTYLAVGYGPAESAEGREELERKMKPGVYDVAQIILFVMPAMGVVEAIDHFDGFALVTRGIQKMSSGSPGILMPILCLLTFIFSAVIDNLTATILALKILRLTLSEDRLMRHIIGGLVVLAANAGGAWSPVGDVTTTMLWLSDKVTVPSLVCWLILPSLVAGVLPMSGLYWELRKEMRKRARAEEGSKARRMEEGDHSGALSEATQIAPVTCANVLVLVLGIGSIMFVPVMKMVTGLPPYMGMLAALGIVWFVTDTHAFHRLARPNREVGSAITLEDSGFSAPPHGSVIEALHKMDLTGLLFFAGVLLAVGALDAAGVLQMYAEWLVRICDKNPFAIATFLGVSSAVVDNVPLVQAAIRMFDHLPVNDPLWHLVALAAGTGGSILSIGSIAGVTLMTMEGVGYMWYVKKVSLWALLGFIGGIATYWLEYHLFV
jgi:Na+/H+ antiporter NhaD/arsenite permease-like protein